MRGFVIKILCHTCAAEFGLCEDSATCAVAEGLAMEHCDANPGHEIEQRFVPRPD